MATCPTCGGALGRADDTCPHCSTQALPAVSSGFPSIPGYRILHRLGEGGMGQVFLAEDVQLGRRVAIKLISERVSSDAAMSSRFLREARLLATIEHPHVVRVYSFGQVESTQYLVMEYVEGESLAALIHREGPLPVERALRIVRETVEGLEAAQELNIVHRDIKPANILLDRRGRVRVADFGLAKQSASAPTADSSITQAGYVLGSPHYLSPEQAQGQATDFRSDLYSLGVVLYEMLTGERPFEGSTPIAIVARHLHDPLPPIRSKRADVPPAVATLIERLTAKELTDRPQSYAEVRQAIEAIGAAPTADSAPTLLQTRVTPAPKKTAWQAWVVPIVIIIALVAVWWVQTRPLIREAPVTPAAPADRRLAIAVTPFYGPDEDSQKEGRVMAALVERSIGTRLRRDEVRILGIDQTKEPVRSHEEARALAKKLGAHVVVWGEAFALRGETEIQPYITAVELSAPSVAPVTADVAPDSASLDRLGESEAGAVRLAAQAPNQIELRKTSAEGVGQMATYLAGIYALHREKNPRKALRLFDQAPQSVELMRQKAQAHIAGNEFKPAIELLSQVVGADANAHEARAQLADVLTLEGRLDDALAHYRILAALSPPVPTRNAVLYDGSLLVREFFQSETWTSSDARDSGNLLVIDPATMTVRRRFALPGFVQRFVPRDGAIFVEYRSSDRSGAPLGTVEYRSGGFTRPMPRGENLLMRMNSIRSGWVIPANFLEDINGVVFNLPPVARFRPTARPAADAPATFPELEAALRGAIERDPTQPWHVFFLGQTLAATGRHAEAEALWERMFAQRYEGVGYYEWARMAQLFGRLGQERWLRRGMNYTERLRMSDPQPVQTSILIERLINVAYTRYHPKQLLDDGLRLAIHRSARKISGVTEGDHFATAAWRAEFERVGNRDAAREEEAWYRRTLADPMNLPAQSTLLDYSVYLAAAAMLAFWTLLVVAFTQAMPVSQKHGSYSDFRAMVARGLNSRYRLAIISVAAAIGVSILGGVVTAVTLGKTQPLMVALLLAIFGLLALRVPGSRSSFGIAVAAIPWRARWTILGAALLVFLSGANAMHRFGIFSAVERMPLLSDSFGHVSVRQNIERAQKKRDTPEARYAIAASHHIAGEFEEARRHYATVSDDPRTARALQRVERGDRRIEMPSSWELVEIFRESVLPLHPRHVIEALRLADGKSDLGLLPLIFLPTIVAVLILAIAFWRVRPEPREKPRVSRAGIMTETLLPGAYDWRRDSPLRGALTVLSFFLVLLVALAAQWSLRLLSSPGPLTALSVPSVFSSAPFPTHGYRHIEDKTWEYDRWTMAMAHPYAGIFWTIIALAALFVVAVHVRALLAIYRQRKSQATVITATAAGEATP